MRRALTSVLGIEFEFSSSTSSGASLGRCKNEVKTGEAENFNKTFVSIRQSSSDSVMPGHNSPYRFFNDVHRSST